MLFFDVNQHYQFKTFTIILVYLMALKVVYIRLIMITFLSDMTSKQPSNK